MGIIYSILFGEKQFGEREEKELKDSLSQLPNYGTLKQIEEIPYVDVDDRFIIESMKVLEPFGWSVPPGFYDGMVGAHFLFLYKDEEKQVDLSKLMGTQVEFYIDGFQTKHDSLNNAKFLLVVKSDNLDAIREEACLDKTKNQYYITVAFKPLKYHWISM